MILSRERERESRQNSSAEDESSRGGIHSRIGYIEHGTGKHQSNEVFSTDGLCRTLQSELETRNPVKILERERERVSESVSLNAEQENIKAIKSTEQMETLERLMQQSTNTQCLSKAIRSGGKGSLDRHMWDLISEDI